MMVATLPVVVNQYLWGKIVLSKSNQLSELIVKGAAYVFIFHSYQYCYPYASTTLLKLCFWGYSFLLFVQCVNRFSFVVDTIVITAEAGLQDSIARNLVS